MGLDMYLFRCKKNESIKDNPTEIGYRRKANQIHNWFVENVQNGVDDCENYLTTKEQLENLLNVCKKVNSYRKKNTMIKSQKYAKKYLPTREGFFFGCVEYDDLYFGDIENTVEQIERILKETDFNQEKIYYCSWW